MLDILQQQLAHYPGRQYWLGLSGGLDSCVLLHMLHSLNIPVRAVHVHHGLSPNADAWADFCAAECARYAIPFEVHRVQVNSAGSGIEEAARNARYGVFKQILPAGAVLLLAHHADDQAETFFMRALRGSGVNGLAAMPVSRDLHGAVLLRPLLDCSRAELTAYAQQHALAHIHDESNDNNRFERNYWRNEILPKLWQRFPAGRSGLNNTLQALQQDKTLLNQLMLPAIQTCCPVVGELHLQPWQALAPLQRDYVIRAWLMAVAGQAPAQKIQQQIQQQLTCAAQDSELCIRWQAWEVRRYRDKAFCMALLPAKPAADVVQLIDSNLPIGHLSGIAQLNDAYRYQVRFYRGGENIRMDKRPLKSLKKIFQENAVPPWLRDFWPLIYCADELCCIPGLAIAQGTDNSLQYLHWQH